MTTETALRPANFGVKNSVNAAFCSAHAVFCPVNAAFNTECGVFNGVNGRKSRRNAAKNTVIGVKDSTDGVKNTEHAASNTAAGAFYPVIPAFNCKKGLATHIFLVKGFYPVSINGEKLWNQ